MNGSLSRSPHSSLHLLTQNSKTFEGTFNYSKFNHSIIQSSNPIAMLRTNDLQLIQQLFFKDQQGIIHLDHHIPGKNELKFYYINNPDKSIRWIFPEGNDRPVFLDLYNNDGWKAKCYRMLMTWSYRLGLYSFFTSGSFFIESQEPHFKQFFDDTSIEEYAIFTGTAGKNRKAIVALHQNKKCTQFIKIPLTSNAQALVQNEKQQLQELEKIQLTKMVIPKGTGNREYLRLENVKPNAPIAAQQFNNRHLEALGECYENTFAQSTPQRISPWRQITDGITFLQSNLVIQNEIPPEKIKAIRHHLNTLFEQVSSITLFPVGLAHGDFTPWNMYETKDKIHVYDWEMSSPDMPLLFDAFHYIFQSNILIHQQSFDHIKKELQLLQKNPILQNIVEKHSIDWSQHYAFYLLYIVSYYLPLYIRQKELHTQAHWLIDCWREALLDLIQSEELTTNRLTQMEKNS